MNHTAHGRLVPHHLPQLTPAQNVPPQDTMPLPAHHRLEHSMALARGFLHQHGIRKSPNTAVAAATMDELPRVVPQQMLHPLCRRHWAHATAFLVEISHAHRKFQWESLDESSVFFDARGIQGHRGPTVCHALQRTQLLLAGVLVIHVAFHSAGARKMLVVHLQNEDFEMYLIHQLIPGHFLVLPQFQAISAQRPIQPPNQQPGGQSLLVTHNLPLGPKIRLQSLLLIVLLYVRGVALHSVHNTRVEVVMRFFGMSLQHIYTRLLRSKAHPPALHDHAHLRICHFQPTLKVRRLHEETLGPSSIRRHVLWILVGIAHPETSGREIFGGGQILQLPVLRRQPRHGVLQT